MGRIIGQDIQKITSNIKFEKEKRIFLITGATGFIGRYIVLSLLYANKHKIANIGVVVIARNIRKAEEIFKEYLGCENFWIYESDMLEEYKIEQEVDYIIHAASNTNGNEFRTNPYKVMNENISSTRCILELAKQKKVRKILYISTAQVYGELLHKANVKEEYLGGNASMAPLACYSESKRASEYLVSAFGSEYGIENNVVRLFSVYGPEMKLNAGTLFSNIFKQALENKEVIINGNGRGVRNMCYISDVIEGIFKVFFEGVFGEAYNVGNESENFTIAEFAQTVSEVIGNNKRVVIRDCSENVLITNSVQVPCFEKILQLGYKSDIQLKDGLKRMKLWIESME